MTNQITQQSNADQGGKAVVSLVLGIISLIFGVGIIYIYIPTFGTSVVSIVDYIYIYPEVFLIMNLIISLTGIIFGKTGLKSTKKIMGTVGIGLCTINLLGVILYYLIIKGIAGSM